MRMEIECVDVPGAEHFEDELRPHAAPAADLERVPAGDGAAHVEQATRLEVPRHRRANRVVHERLLDRVQEHDGEYASHIVSYAQLAFGGGPNRENSDVLRAGASACSRPRARYPPCTDPAREN